MIPVIVDSYNKGKADGREEYRNEIIDLIREHQKECDALGVIATAQWVKDLIEEGI